jgi:hypothetical protein
MFQLRCRFFDAFRQGKNLLAARSGWQFTNCWWQVHAMCAVIVPGAAAGDLCKRALQGGMLPLTLNAIEQARQRHPLLAEVYRISQETV